MDLALDTAVLDMGKTALQILREFLAGRLSPQELREKLSGLPVVDYLERFWGELTSDPRLVPHWHVLQTLQGIIEEGEYQVAEYGLASVHEDLTEIAYNLKLIAERA